MLENQKLRQKIFEKAMKATVPEDTGRVFEDQLVKISQENHLFFKI